VLPNLQAKLPLGTFLSLAGILVLLRGDALLALHGRIVEWFVQWLGGGSGV
jgi:hypothetical protein